MKDIDHLLNQFWINLLDDPNADYKDKLKASEYLAKFSLNPCLDQDKATNINISLNPVSVEDMDD